MRRQVDLLRKATVSTSHFQKLPPTTTLINPFPCSSQCTLNFRSFSHAWGAWLPSGHSLAKLSSTFSWQAGMAHSFHSDSTSICEQYSTNDVSESLFCSRKKIMHLRILTDSHLQQVNFCPSVRTLKHPNLHFGCRPISAFETAKIGFTLSAKGTELEHSRHIHFGSGLSSVSDSDKATLLSSIRFSKPGHGRMHGIICAFSRTHMGHAHEHHDHKHNDDTGEAGERVSRLGLIADICLTAGKGFAGYASGSTAVIADAAHSMSDVVLSGVALWIFKAARAPKDQMHPYGHGKFETLGALGISSMLLLTGGGIAWHAFEVLQGLLSATDATSVVSNLHSGAEHANSIKHEHAHGGHYHGFDKEHQALALTATLISIGVKEGLFWVTKRVGDARGSELLKANAWHHRSDAISSVIALLGVGGAMLGWHFLDPLAGLLVSGLIFRAGLQTGYRSLQELVDSALPNSVLSPFKETVMSVKGVKGCHALRGRRAGSSIHLDVHIEVDPWLSVSAAHMIGETTRQELRAHHTLLEDIFIHVEPADPFGPSSHVTAEDSNCNGHMQTDNSYQQLEVERVVRGLVQSNFDKVMAFERVRCHFLQGRLLVELEVSMEPTMSIRDGMHHARKAEELIMKSYPKISAVETQLRLTKYL
eukprot:c22420_g1_i2 orf=614-2557(-)